MARNLTARGDLLHRLDRLDEARDAFAAALACPVNGAERACIERKLAACEVGTEFATSLKAH